MRIIVASDSHGDTESLEKLCTKHRDADYILFLGDGEGDVECVRDRNPSFPLVAVKGNCDMYCSEPNDKLLSLDGMTIFMTHGHNYSVKYTTDLLETAALQLGANVILFGHTHYPLCQWKGDYWLANPGSLGHPKDGIKRYLIIDSVSNGAYCYLSELK